MSQPSAVFTEPVTQVDLRRLADFERKRPKIHMVRELRPDPERGRPAMMTYGPFVAIAAGLATGLLLSLVRTV